MSSLLRLPFFGRQKSEGAMVGSKILENLGIFNLDRVYRLLMRNNFYANGLGSVRTLEHLYAVRGKAFELVSATHPVHVVKTERHKTHKLIQGSFVSPLSLICPEIVPAESRWARFQFVLPADFDEGQLKNDPMDISQELLGLIKEINSEEVNSSAPLQSSAYSYLDSIPSFAPPSLMELSSQFKYQVRLGEGSTPSVIPSRIPKPVLDNISGLFEKYATKTGLKLLSDSQMPASSVSSLPNSNTDKNAKNNQPVSVMFPATGDHSFWRRRIFSAIPLLEQAGIASLLLENPLYGDRRPRGQFRSNLKNVFDLYVMGALIQFETVVLLNWLERSNLGPLGLSGMSMGGHMASLASTVWPKPLALVNYLGPATASGVFTRGVLSLSCNWKAIRNQIQQYHPNIITNEKEYLEKLMDDVTGIFHYKPPVCTKAAILLAATDDAYVPLEDIQIFKDFWPDAELRYMNSGHIGSFLFGQKEFIKAIIDSFERVKKE